MAADFAHDRSFIAGKVCAVYGGTTGLGVGLAKGLAEASPSVLYVFCRSLEKGRRLAAQLAPTPVELIHADGTSMASVRAAGESLVSKLKQNGQSLNVLLLNAATIPGTRTLTEEQYEEGFAVNHLSFCELVASLAPSLARPGEARIVVTGSEAGQAVKWKIDFDNLQAEKGIKNATEAFMHYAHLKTMNLAYSVELAERLRHRGVLVNTFHPGAVKSEIGNSAFPCMAPLIKTCCCCCFRSPSTGATLGLYLAGSTALSETGAFYASGNTCAVRNFDPVPLAGDCADPAARAKLWETTEKLLGHPLL